MTPDQTEAPVTFSAESMQPAHASTTVPARLYGWLSPYLTYFTAGLATLILFAGTATLIACAYLMKVGYSVIPFWDEMHEIQLYISQQHSLLRWIWAQHNEHRILFYKLLFVVDMHVFEGRNWPMFVAIFGCQVVLAAIFAFVLWKFGCLKGSPWVASFGLALYCLFCPSQRENFSWAFQLSFALVTVWVTMAILLVILQKQDFNAGRPFSGWKLLASLAVAMAASFTNGNGIVVWPIMIVLALSIRLPWRLVGLQIVGFACSASLYLIGYRSMPPPHAHPLESIQKPLQVLQFIESYLGGALVSGTHIDWATQIGQAGLLIGLVMIYRLITRREKAGLLDYFLAGILLYSLATAFITSLGRLTLGINQAFASRYQGFALLFWLALAVWLISLLTQRRATIGLIAVYLLVLFIIGSTGKDFRPILEEVRDSATRRDTGGVAMIVGVHDDDFLKQAVCPFPAVTWTAVEYLKEHGLSLFSEKMAEQLGQDFSRSYTVTTASPCRGSVDSVRQADGSSNHLRLEGWIVDHRNKPVPRLLFVDGGKIVGFGVPGYQRIDVVNAIQSNKAFRSGWAGYANIPETDRMIDVYGVLDLDKGKACYLQAVRSAAEANGTSSRHGLDTLGGNARSKFSVNNERFGL